MTAKWAAVSKSTRQLLRRANHFLHLTAGELHKRYSLKGKAILSGLILIAAIAVLILRYRDLAPLPSLDGCPDLLPDLRAQLRSMALHGS